MKQRFWRFLFAAFLAWLFGALLINVLVGSLPIAGYLFSTGKAYFAQDKPLGEWLWSVIFSLDFVNFLIAFPLFVIILQGLGVLLGFALPAGRKYETTKLLRRIQGISFELLIIFSFFCLIPYLFLSFSGWTAFAPGPSFSESASMEVYRGFGWTYNRQIDKTFIYVEFIKGYWFVLLPVSTIIYLLNYWIFGDLIKRIIVAVHGRFLEFLEARHFGHGGSARFAGLFEEWALRLNFRLDSAKIENTLFFGRSLYSRSLNIGITDDRHATTIAGSRSGKGKNVIIPNLLTWKGSVLVIDTKGINAAVTAGRRREMGQNVYIVDPFEILEKSFLEKFGNGETDGFNPLTSLIKRLENDPDGKNKKRIREDIGVLADALIISEENEKGSHWEQGSKTVLAGLIAHLISSPKFRDKKPALQMIRDLLATDFDNLPELLDDLTQNREAGGLARDAGTRLTRGIGTDEILNILSSADKHSEFLSSEAIQNVLSKESFNFSDLKNKRTTIYLAIPSELLDEHRRFIRMFINSALSEMPKQGRSKTPVLMILDEFQQLGVMKEVEKAYRLLAGFNFVIHAFFQDYSGIKAYGNGANSFISSSRAVQVFGLSDLDSLEFISKKIGGRSTQSPAGTNSMHTIPLRSTDEIEKEISAKGTKQYILRAGQTPLVIERVEYFESEKSIFRSYLTRSIFSSDKANEKAFIVRAFKSLLGNFYPFHSLYDEDPDYKKESAGKTSV